MSEKLEYMHLARRDGSSYQQLFVKGRNLRAETLYRATVGPEPMTPDGVAQDYGVPVEAVREAIDYCERHGALLERERAEDWAQSHPPGPAAAPPVASGAGIKP